MTLQTPPKIGLLIGKFAQLHLGHVDLIQFALKQVDKLYIVMYHVPDKTDIPLSERAGWIRSLFPSEDVVVIEGWNAPNAHEDTPEVRRMQEDYLGGVMRGVNLTHFFSSEDYGEHLSAYFGVHNIVYDRERVNRPISSTMIRADFHKHADQIPELVRERLRTDPKVKQQNQASSKP